MGGSNGRPMPDQTVCGKKGKYRLLKEIGSGGNSLVFSAKILELDSHPTTNSSTVAIKFLDVSSKNKREQQKRIARFENELKYVQNLQDHIEGIIPIIDSSPDGDDSMGLSWYTMPLANQYNPQQYSTEEKLCHLREVANCLQKIHVAGIAHRDIKPRNLLLYQDRLCLCDFGLLWDQNGDSHITLDGDHVGPRSIMPLELRHIGRFKNVDYRKSDVYLFGKTLWMLLSGQINVPFEEYTRIPQCMLDCDKLGLKTIEPLHELLEQSTQQFYWDRIDISECIKLLDSQIEIARDRLPSESIMTWKRIERANHIKSHHTPDRLGFVNENQKLLVLQSIVGLALSFEEAGMEYPELILAEVSLHSSSLYECKLRFPFMRRNSSFLMAIDEITISGDSFIISLSPAEITVSGYTATNDLHSLFEIRENKPDKIIINTACKLQTK